MKITNRPRLRIKQNADADELSLSPEPSTSREEQPSSPISSRIIQASPESPIGRVAKKNAKLLNGLDINGQSQRSSTYSNQIVGTVADLKLSELSIPTYKKFKNTNSNSLTSEIWHNLQHELETVVSDNIEMQETLHGEIEYLTTGEYPITNLSDRAMPSYGICRSPPSSRTPISNRFDDGHSFISELGLFSSPEEDDDPCVVDIPQRFWKWARTYLRHVSDENLMEFKEKLLDRFNSEMIVKYCQDNPSPSPTKSIKTRSKRIATKHQNIETNGGEYPRITTNNTPPSRKRKPHQRTSSDAVVNSSPMKCPKTEQQQHLEFTPLCNGVKNDLQLNSITPRNEAKSRLNGGNRFLLNGHGLEFEYESDDDDDNAMDYELKAGNAKVINGFLPDKLPTKSGRNSPSEKLVFKEMLSKLSGSSLSKLGLGATLIQTDIKDNGIKNEVDDDEHTDAYQKLDEVSRELKKKQQQLKQLYNSTRPLIEEMYSRLLCEFAVNEMFRRQDDEDDKLIELGKKYEPIKTFKKDQQTECDSAMFARRNSISM